MKNCITNFSKMGIVLLLIVIFGTLNAICDTVTLILMLTGSFDGNVFFSFYSRLFAEKNLFLIAMPLTLLCNILFLVFMFTRKLFLFQLFFLCLLYYCARSFAL